MLSKIKIFLTKYWLFIFLGALVILIAAIKITKPKLAPSPPTAPSLPFLSPPTIEGREMPKNAQILITEFKFPKEIKVYQGQLITISSEEAREIAKNLGFTGEPLISEDVLRGTFYSWSENKNYLSIGLAVSKLTFGQDLLRASPPKEGALPSPSESQKILEELLDKINLVPSVSFKTQAPKYFAFLEPRTKEASLEEADLIQVGFNPAVDDYQILGQDPDIPLIYITLGKDKKIYKLEVQAFFTSLAPKDSYPLKDLDEIKNTISDQGKIVYWNLPGENLELTFQSASFNQVFLDYFQSSSKEEFIQPIYILTGTGTLNNGQIIEIIAYLPAVSFEKFTSVSPAPESKFKP